MEGSLLEKIKKVYAKEPEVLDEIERRLSKAKAKDDFEIEREIREIPKKEHCLITIKVDGEIWGDVEYYGIVNESNISKYAKENSLITNLEANTESSNVEIIREKGAPETRANFNIKTKEHLVRATEEQKTPNQNPTRNKKKTPSRTRDLQLQQRQEQARQKIGQKTWLIDIVINNDEKPIRIEYNYFGKFKSESLIEYIKKEIWPEKFKKFGLSDKFNFRVDILKK
jgi:hypothetical protein